jgi:hypothetical protein
MSRYSPIFLLGLALVLLDQSRGQQAQAQSDKVRNGTPIRCGDTICVASKASDIAAFKNG